MPVATTTTTSAQNTIETLKSAIADLSIAGTIPQSQVQAPSSSSSSSNPERLRQYSHFDATPSIGTEFRAYSPDGKPTLSIRDLLDDEDGLRALGRLVSERGVVFFRDAIISPEEQITLVDKLGKLGGKPSTSGLHVHPLTSSNSEFGDEISMISNQYVFDDKYKRNDRSVLQRRFHGDLWHSDITFEPVPSDYATLQIRELPKVGGDTLWASAYEAYDRLSPAYRILLEGLTATHTGQNFVDLANKQGQKLREPRGAPENVGQTLSTVHPVIRTNPVTGWKGLFVNRGFTKRINELTKHESDNLLEFLFEHISANHDLQVRFRWEPNSLAIWDNRSTFHTATEDLDDDKRVGTRSVSLGERPYLDPKSLSRREALAEATQS
ncbi:taurine dioxygenase [Kwoniella heveanensis CBS 569]|uniref:Taurine dioxygenase n=1 Tax=Kwoniella heveanensis BCC8398 TaxID=1296120 RepID=A0A1B9GMD5_9TREE|nr:taurine dioxygenase [Kwoniella heveanensis BCC8398]OCF39059.1 taurine dioxygenase [Kwoniella heveanensis CBS 569]